MPLTDSACRNAKCPADAPRKRYADGAGLYLECTPAGGKYWRLKYSVAGKEKRLALGVYPAVTLAAARAARTKAKAKLVEGIDPSAERQAAKVTRATAAANDFETVGRAWHAFWKPTRTEHHAGQVMRRLEADVFPHVGKLPITAISTPTLIGVVKKIEARGASDIAKRAWQTMSMIFRYAVAHGLAERNPAADVRPGDIISARTAENYARVSVKELPELLRKMVAYPGTAWTRAALQLVAMTFVRTSELIEATWDEFDLDAAEWRIPAHRMKSRVQHIVPLSTQAIDELQCLAELRNTSPFVFPGERDHMRPMSNMTILKAIGIMGFKGRMTGHGFRGIASTELHEMGYPHAVIELQLAHTARDRTAAAYNHAEHLPERRKMLQAWADRLDELRKGGRVMPIRAA